MINLLLYDETTGEISRSIQLEDVSQVSLHTSTLDYLIVDRNIDILMYKVSQGALEFSEHYYKRVRNDKRTTSVASIKVMISTDKVFDGDETSQDRMVRAINIASITGLTETQWKLANNEIVMVTLDELKEALALAGQEMSRIWLEQ